MGYAFHVAWRKQSTIARYIQRWYHKVKKLVVNKNLNIQIWIVCIQICQTCFRDSPPCFGVTIAQACYLGSNRAAFISAGVNNVLHLEHTSMDWGMGSIFGKQAARWMPTSLISGNTVNPRRSSVSRMRPLDAENVIRISVSGKSRPHTTHSTCLRCAALAASVTRRCADGKNIRQES